MSFYELLGALREHMVTEVILIPASLSDHHQNVMFLVLIPIPKFHPKQCCTFQVNLHTNRQTKAGKNLGGGNTLFREYNPLMPVVT